MSEWIYKKQKIIVPPEHAIGFVYMIKNKINNKKYFGQKVLFNKITKKPLKGKNNKRHFKVQSDWIFYFGSCEELKKDIQLYGEDNFDRIILLFVDSKVLLNYFETWIQMYYGVLFKPNEFYNGIINCRISRSQIISKVNNIYNLEKEIMSEISLDI